jgi:hypothetical protein
MEQEEIKMTEETKNNLTDEEIEENEDVEDQDSNKDDSGKSGKDDELDENKGGDDKGKSSKTFTQEQVNKMMTREKNQGRNAALRELGIDPKDSKMIAMIKSFIESQKTDEQKAAEKDAENQTKMNEAERRAQVAEAKAEAMMLGVKTQYVEDAVTLALAKMTEDSDLKTIIGEFKTKYPIWFGESEDDEKGGKDKGKGKIGQKGTGSSIKPSKEDKGKEEKSLGARLAAQRRGTGKKSSYWGNNK